jgi:hypothetical protein
LSFDAGVANFIFMLTKDASYAAVEHALEELSLLPFRNMSSLPAIAKAAVTRTTSWRSMAPREALTSLASWSCLIRPKSSA